MTKLKASLFYNRKLNLNESLESLKNSGSNLAVFPEYHFNLSDMINNSNEIQNFSKNNNCDMLFVPNNNSKLKKVVELSEIIKNSGHTFDSSSLNKNAMVYCLGVWFGMDLDSIHFFPRTNYFGFAHKIPERDYLIASLSSEIHLLNKKESIQRKIILNPCNNGRNSLMASCMYAYGVGLDNISNFLNINGISSRDLINLHNIYPDQIENLLSKNENKILIVDKKETSGFFGRVSDLEFNDNFSTFKIEI